MRVATWNILSGRTPGEATVDTTRFTEAVRHLDADVLGLQEVDRSQSRSGHHDLAAVAAEAMGATVHRFAAAIRGTPGQGGRPATDDDPDDGPAYGVALLSRYPVASWRTIRLPGLPMPMPYLWPDRRRPSWVRDEPRVAVLAEVQTPRGPLTVVNTHLSFLRPSGRRQLRRLLRALPPNGGTLLLGDLNLPLSSVARLTPLRPLARHDTFPADRPNLQIDHVLTDVPALAPVHSAAVRLAVSDHRALVVDLDDRR